MKKVNIIKYLGLIILILAFQNAMAQENRLTVQISDSKGNPLSNVKVEILSLPDASLMSGPDGKATFNVVPEGFIRVSYLDIEKIVPALNSDVEVILQNDDRKVQFGYGLERAADQVTAAIDVAWSDELSKSPALNPEESLFGQLTGLSVLQNGGEPWSRGPDMLIRGKSTFNNSSLLVLVDGFERDLSSLSLEEIESVSVLKDGAALAMYGQRGANGVLLVTTKRGRSKSLNVDISYEQGINMPFRMPEFLNSSEYAAAVNQANLLDGNSPFYSEWDLQDFASGQQPWFYPNVNWIEESLKEFGTNAKFNSSFTGGGEAVKYFVTINYQNERGLFENTTLDERYDSQLKYDRFNFRTNLDIELTNTTNFQINVAGSIDGRKEPGARASNIFSALYSVPSGAFPVKTLNGEWGGTEYYDNNPVALISSSGLRKPHGRGIMADGRIIQDLNKWVKGLSVEAALGYDNQVNYWESKTRGFKYESVILTRDQSSGVITDTTIAVYGSDTDLSASDSFGGQRRHATLSGKINYENSWQDNDLNASLIYIQDKRVNDGQYNTFLHQNLAGVFSYGVNDRYFLDGVLSYSGSYILPDNERFGLFPSISGAWILSREDFLVNSPVVNYLKIRASWGLSGNDIMQANLFDQGFISGGTYYFTNNNTATGGIIEGQLPTTGLTYEKSAKYNAGLDAELFKHLKVNLDAFYEKRSDILASMSGSVPSLIGVDRPFQNLGIVENKGIEGTLLWNDRIGDFNYRIEGNVTFVRNKIIEMNEEKRLYDYLRQTGNPVGQEFGLVSIGFFRDEADIQDSPKQLFSAVRPGDIKYVDQNNDNVIDQLDVVPLGYAGGYPEVYYATDLGLEYKGFGVDVQFQGIAHQTLYLNTKSVFWPLRGQTTISTFSNDSWTPQTASTATLPRLSMVENANNYRRNDIWLKKGDYLKLRYLNLYYNFPERVLKNVKMKSATIFVRGMNLFSFDAVDVLDPEDISTGYPSLASYSIGVKLGF